MRYALRFLPSFLAVVDAGGVRAAAARLHKTQAAVSYDLQQLQAALGVRLFVRSGRELRPTATGERLAQAGGDWLAVLEAAVGSGREETTPVHIAAVSGFGRYVAHRRLMRHADGRPLRMHYLLNDAVLAQVRDAQADFGFCFSARPSRALTFVPVYRERLVLVVPPDWRMPREAVSRRRLLAERPAVTYDESDYVFARWFDAAYRDPRHRCVPGDHYAELEETLAAVAAGRGYSIVPGDAAQALARLHPVRIPASQPRVENQVHAVHRVGDDRWNDYWRAFTARG